MYQEIISNITNNEPISLLLSNDNNRLDIDVTYNSIDPIKGIANITVSGYKICGTQLECALLGRKILIANFNLASKNTDIIPSYHYLALPEETGTYEHIIHVPISGTIATYPYDK